MKILFFNFASAIASSLIPLSASSRIRTDPFLGRMGTASLERSSRHLHISANNTDFQKFCDGLEDRPEGLQCQCHDSPIMSAQCGTGEMCNHHHMHMGGEGMHMDSDHVCGEFSFDFRFDEDNLQVTSTEFCVNYTSATGRSRHKNGCGHFMYANNLTESCEFEFENEFGSLTTCNSCELCSVNGKLGINIDCDNIEEDASTKTCLAIEGRNDTEMFPGFRPEEDGSSASNTDFQKFCDGLEERPEGLHCKCHDSPIMSAQCGTGEMCNHHHMHMGGEGMHMDSDHVCGEFSFDFRFDEDNLQVTSTEFCVNYTSATGRSRHKNGCGHFMYANNLTESCEFEFENEFGSLTTCNSCELCSVNGKLGINIDCDNIEEDASTKTCLAIEGRNDTEMFPGFRPEEDGSSSSGPRGPWLAFPVILFVWTLAGIHAW